MTVKIFKMNENDWVAAEDLDSAMCCLSLMVHDGSIDGSFLEDYIDDPCELTDEEMNTMKLGDEDDYGAAVGHTKEGREERLEKYRATIPTFCEALEKQLKTQKPPFYFAGTE